MSVSDGSLNTCVHTNTYTHTYAHIIKGVVQKQMLMMLFFISLSPLIEKSPRISKKSGFGGKPQRGRTVQSDDQFTVICYNCYLLHKMAHDST